jgi:hypothetical protein
MKAYAAKKSTSSYIHADWRLDATEGEQDEYGHRAQRLGHQSEDTDQYQLEEEEGPGLAIKNM